MGDSEMETVRSEELARQNLLDRILNCVKQVQAHFGAKQEIATEVDARVSAMCTEWEAVLTHGAKKPKPKNSLRLTGRQDGVSLWPLARLSVSMEDLQRFSRLDLVNTEVGRGRAWLRAAINERTLETYLHIILGQEVELRKLYEGHGFLLDQERSSMLPIMAAGLSSIIFSIAVDVHYLNTSQRSVHPAASPSPKKQVEPPEARLPSETRLPPEARLPSETRLPPVTHLPPETRLSLTTAASSQPSIMTNPRIMSIDSLSGFQPRPLPTTNFHSLLPPPGDGDEVIAVNMKKPKKKKSKSKSSSSSLNGATPTISPGTVTPESRSPLPGSPDKSHDSTRAVLVEENESCNLTFRESASSSSSHLSLTEVAEGPTFVALPARHMVNSDVEEAIDATAQLLSNISGPLPLREEEQLAVGGLGTTTPPRDTPSSALNSDLRTAMLTLSTVKDTLEIENKELKMKIQDLEDQVDKLLRELEQARHTYRSIQEAHSGKLQVLERENDLLREQLKKYVSLVQQQLTQSPCKPAPLSEVETAAGLDGEGGGGEPVTSDPTLSQGAGVHSAITDQKLQQMAEMYGDLMELNERLHRDLADKDALIGTLVRSLKDSSLELPVPVHQLPPVAMETKASVDVWIPSVIKKGRGPDGFHVYQVFVCIKAVEWNIYRRYAEFREFHRQLQKHVPELVTFNFPPKKALGRKSAQVVEDRRVRLQDYLRFVIKTCSSSRNGKGPNEKLDPVITPAITKVTFVTMFPFFKEDFNTDSSSVVQPPSYSGL